MKNKIYLLLIFVFMFNINSFSVFAADEYIFAEDFQDYEAGDGATAIGWVELPKKDGNPESSKTEGDAFEIVSDETINGTDNKVLRYYDYYENSNGSVTEQSQFSVAKMLDEDLVGKLSVSFKVKFVNNGTSKKIRFKDAEITSVSTSGTQNSNQSGNELLSIGQWNGVLYYLTEGSTKYSEANYNGASWLQIDMKFTLTGTDSGNTVDICSKLSSGETVLETKNIPVGGSGVLRSMVIDTPANKGTTEMFFDDFRIKQLTPPENTAMEIINPDGSTAVDSSNVRPNSSYKLKFEAVGVLDEKSVKNGVKLLKDGNGSVSVIPGSLTGGYNSEAGKYLYEYTFTTPALDWNSAYSVVVENVKDEYDVAMDARAPWQFATAMKPYEYTLEGDASGCSVNITKNSSESLSHIFAVAQIDSGIMGKFTAVNVPENGGIVPIPTEGFLTGVPMTGFMMDKNIFDPAVSAEANELAVAVEDAEKPTELTVSGNAGLGNSEITLLILKKAETDQPLSIDNISEKAEYIATAKTQENGSYSFIWKQNAEAESGDRTILLQRAFGQSNLTVDYYYSNPREAEQVLERMKDDPAAAISIMLGKMRVLGLDQEAYDDLGDDEEVNLNAQILSNLSEITTPEELQEIFRRELTVQQINMAQTGNDIYAMITNNADDLQLSESSLYTSYEELEETAQKAVCEKLVDKDIKEDGKLKEYFEDALVLTLLEEVQQYGDIYGVLYNANDVLKIDFTVYNGLGSTVKNNVLQQFALLIDNLTDRNSIVSAFGTTVTTEKGKGSGISGGISGGGSGGGGKKSSSISSITIDSNNFAVKEEVLPIPGNEDTAVFADLDEAQWAKEEITMLSRLGLISGYGDGSFKPNAPITRAEFLKITLSCLMITEERGGIDFLDVLDGDWFYPSVATALKLGIVSGIDDDFFAPNKKITREEMATILYRAMQKKNIKPEEARGTFAFEDAGEISEFAAEAVEYLYRVGIISGYSETEFAPRSTATRAQAAKMLASLVKER